jgi:hypothetical protein
MAPGNNALQYCICCKQFVAKKAELAHRRAMFSHPYASAHARPESTILNLNSVFESAKSPSTTHSHPTATDSQMDSQLDTDGPTMDDSVDMDFDDPELAIEEARDTLMPSFPSLHIQSAARIQDDDDDDEINDNEGEIPVEDHNEPGNKDIVDWEMLEVELASMGTLGQEYAVYAAEVGVSPCFPCVFLSLIVVN